MPQLLYVYSLFGGVGSYLHEIRRVVSSCQYASHVSISVTEVFDSDARRMSTGTLLAQLQDHLENLNDPLLIATGGSVNGARLGAGIFIPRLHTQFSVRLPDFTPVYDAEMLAATLVLQRVPSNFRRVLILSDPCQWCRR